ncbi:ComEA family DNA-binding protein [Neptunicella sp. SCSIO 80796]|uniref:ComEA family DNA-binding protein n=1 Tax=Neptunicella plasticusilytica TaxID=3117012 RepID=UPI003A4D486E
MKKIIIPLLLGLASLTSLNTLAVDDVKMPKKEQMQTQQINLNTATEKELTKLPGIGKSKAKAIVEYREKHGKFGSAKDLAKIDGIGETVANSLEGKVEL